MHRTGLFCNAGLGLYSRCTSSGILLQKSPPTPLSCRGRSRLREGLHLVFIRGRWVTLAYRRPTLRASARPPLALLITLTLWCACRCTTFTALAHVSSVLPSFTSTTSHRSYFCAMMLFIVSSRYLPCRAPNRKMPQMLDPDCLGAARTISPGFACRSIPRGRRPPPTLEPFAPSERGSGLLSIRTNMRS